jgi:cystathionine gamma-synthase
VHSTTKFLSGHSDVTAGVLLGSHALLNPMAPWRSSLGPTPAPEVASLFLHSLTTLMVRVERQNANALAIATAMSEHSRVMRVLYPGLETFRGHPLARAQMSGFGGMMTLGLAGALEDVTRTIRRLRVLAIAPSLGGIERLATLPYTTSHHGLSPNDQISLGIIEARVRLLIGIEDAADWLGDLQQALR